MAEGSLDPSTLDPGSLDPIETDSYPAKEPSAAATLRDQRARLSPLEGSTPSPSSQALAATSSSSSRPSAAPEPEGDSHETLISSHPERPIFPGPAFVTGTQPSMPAYADPPTSSRDLRRTWHVDEQLHRQDARMRLLEKELAQSRKLTIVATGVGVVGVGLGLLAFLR